MSRSISDSRVTYPLKSSKGVPPIPAGVVSKSGADGTRQPHFERAKEDVTRKAPSLRVTFAGSAMEVLAKHDEVT